MVPISTCSIFGHLPISNDLVTHCSFIITYICIDWRLEFVGILVIILTCVCHDTIKDSLLFLQLLLFLIFCCYQLYQISISNLKKTFKSIVKQSICSMEQQIFTDTETLYVQGVLEKCSFRKGNFSVTPGRTWEMFCCFL